MYNNIVIITIIIIIISTKRCGINPNRLSANQATGFSKSVKMNLIGQRGSRNERLGSEYHSDHHNNSAAFKLKLKNSLVLRK